MKQIEALLLDMNARKRELQRQMDEKVAELRPGPAPVPGFWRPIVARWLVWLGCSWAVGSVIWLLPALVKLIKGAQ